MKRIPSRGIVAGAVCVALGILASSSFAKDEHAEGGAPPEMDDAAMAAWTAAATPGPQHAQLASYAGHWKTEVKSFWMDPNAPVVSVGTSDYTMELGGRVLVGVHKAEMMGMPFEGRSIDGFDNAKGNCWSIWLDNMGTSYMVSTGNISADGKTVTHTGSSWDPMAGKEVNYKMITRIVDANKHIFEMYAVDGKTETKQMEITYTR